MSEPTTASAGPVGVIDRVAGSRPVWIILLVCYLLVVLYLVAPVVTGPIGADDRIWVVRYPPDTGGSPFVAWWQQMRGALDFGLQDRATALTFAERSAIAVAVMNTAVHFAIPPALIWAGLKLSLLGLSVASVWALLRTVRYRDAGGEVRPIGPRTVQLLVLATPLAIGVGVKAQNYGPYSGWTYYPTLCLGLFPSVLLMVVVALRTHDVLAGDFRRWVVPVTLLWVAWGAIVDFSFELLVAALPTVLVALLLHPRPTGVPLVRRWRAAVTIGGALCVSWAVVFGAIKLAIGTRACAATDSCYAGTVIQVSPRTMLLNLGASLPIGTSATSRREARIADVPFPGPSAGAALLGVAGVVLLVALGALVLRRLSRLSAGPASPRAEARGLVAVAASCTTLAIVSSVITGLTKGAVDTITTLAVAYHTGPVAWTGLAVAGLAVGLALTRVQRWSGVAVGALAAALAVAVITVMVPRNALSAQRSARALELTSFVHREVALGQKGAAADRRRCEQVQAALRQEGDPLPTQQAKLLSGAYRSFRFYHHAAFCTTVPRPDPSARVTS